MEVNKIIQITCFFPDNFPPPGEHSELAGRRDSTDRSVGERSQRDSRWREATGAGKELPHTMVASLRGLQEVQLHNYDVFMTVVLHQLVLI